MDINLMKNSPSKSNLINNKPKITSLKDGHFSKFLNSFIDNFHNNYIFDKNTKLRNKLHFPLEDNLKSDKSEISKENIFLNKRNFKNPKYINYRFRLKTSLFKKLKSDEETNTNHEKLLNYNSNYYDPNKISNKFINFTKNDLFEESTKNSKYNINKEKNKKLKINYKSNTKERGGYFGRKEKMGIPYLFDTYTLFHNNYSTKSEKSRHEIVLNDLQRLKGFIQGNPEGKIPIFKDFLKKYNISINSISNNTILFICDILCNNDNDILTHFLKPYLNIKDMILDLINNLSSIKGMKFTYNEPDNNNKTKSKNINFISKDNKENVYSKYNSSSELFNNMNDDLLFKTKLGNKNKHYKDSRNQQYNMGEKNNNTRDFFSQTDNSFYNKNKKTFYQSPSFIPFKSHYILSSKTQPSSKKKKPDLSDTKSLLKNINYQTKALGKRKEYSSNNDLLIDDMSKEIRELENNYYKVLLNNEDNKNRTQTAFNSIKNKIISISQKSIFYKTKDLKFNNKDIFCKTSIQFYKKNKNNLKSNVNLQIISLKDDKINKLRKCISNTEPPLKRKINKKTKSLNEINIRMYYKPIKYKFGYKQIKDKYKITEMAALNFAKKKKFDPMGLICNF